MGRHRFRGGRYRAAGLAALVAAPAALAQPGTVIGEQKISLTAGGFGGMLANADRFGASVTAIGDLDGDMVGDVVIGAPMHDDGGTDRGAVWVVFLHPDGAVKAVQQISRNAGLCGCSIGDGDQFGTGVAGLGDLNGDRVPDLAVGLPGDDDGGTDRGSVYIFFLATDGTVAGRQRISDTVGNFSGDLDDGDAFGWSVAAIGDFDGDTVQDIAVGAIGDDDGGDAAGAIWIVLLNADGTAKDQHKISATAGGFAGPLAPGDLFGSAIAPLGDLGGDGLRDLAVGAMGDDGNGGIPTARGAVWILGLASDATVGAQARIGDRAGGFGEPLDDLDWFGVSLAALPDIDGTGAPDLAVGALRDDDGAPDTGAAWILFLNHDATVAGHQKISSLEGGLSGPLDPGGEFGRGVALIQDPIAGGPPRIVVGAWEDDDGGEGACADVGACDVGAAWVLSLVAPTNCPFDCGEPADGVAGTADLLALLAQWGAPGSCDLDGSGTVGTPDLLALLAGWGECP